MSVSTPTAPVVSPSRGVWQQITTYAPDVAVVATLVWWATYLTWGMGGREPHDLSIGCALLAVAFVAVRPWRVLPAAASVMAHAVGLGAFVVVLTAPTGWAGGDDAASYAFAAELGLVTLAWAGTTERRQLVLTAVVGAAGAQFALGWLPWWGRQDQLQLFQGTFYWHNQAGIFMAAGAVLGFAAIAAGRPVSLAGWILAPLCVAGVVYTTSRGSQIALALGIVLLAAVLRRGHLQMLAAAALSWGVTSVLSGPPFFPERISPMAGTAARSASLEANGVQRIEDWGRAFRIFEHWPVSGAGFNSFASATEVATTRHDHAGTAFAHNGFLQAASDGGLALAVPFLVLLGAVLVLALRGLPAAVRARDAVRLGGLATFVILLLHSGMDFDWAYPSLLALLSLVAVLALPIPTASPIRRPRLDTVLAVAGVALLIVSALSGWDGGLALNAQVS